MLNALGLKDNLDWDYRELSLSAVSTVLTTFYRGYNCAHTNSNDLTKVLTFSIRLKRSKRRYLCPGRKSIESIKCCFFRCDTMVNL